MYSPHWFLGQDILIDVISIIVLLLIGYCCFQYYRLKKRKEHSLFGLSFLLVAFSFILKVITNITIYYTTIETRKMGPLLFTYEIFHTSNIISFWGAITARALLLVGLFLLFQVYYKSEQKATNILVMYLLLLLAYLSQYAPYLIHVTSFILLTLITVKLFQNHHKTKDKLAFIIFLSFLILTVSQLMFIFIDFATMCYVIAEVLQLVGYLLLLISFLLVLSYGKKN